MWQIGIQHYYKAQINVENGVHVDNKNNNENNKKSNNNINSDGNNNGDIRKNGNKVSQMIVAMKSCKYVLKKNPSVMINKIIKHNLNLV